MKIDRLFAGVAVAALVATSAYAQARSGAGGAQTSPYQQQVPSGTTTEPPTSTTPPSATGEPPTAESPSAEPPTAGPSTAGAAGAFTPIVPSPASDIITELKSSGEFTTLLAVLNTTNLTNLVATHPNLTLLAPTDAAFAALPPGQLDALKKNPVQLQALLTYHLIGAKVPATDVKGHAAGKVMTVAKKNVTIDGSSTPIKVNDATVLQAGVPAANGVIYVVDKVLTPTV